VSIELPPPNGDQAVAALSSILGRAYVDKLDARVCLHAIEHHGLNVGAAQGFERRVQQARGFHAWIGHEQGSPNSQQRGLVAELADGAQALNKARRALVGAKCVFQHFF